MADLFNPTSDHESLRELVSQVAGGIVEKQAKSYDEAEECNVELLKQLGSEYQLYGITIPEEAGGHNMDAVASVIIHEELSRFDPALTLSYLSHEVLFINNLYYSSHPELSEKYLPPALSGEQICGMAMSEPEAGTDVLGMKTSFQEKQDCYILSGTKQWITNGNLGGNFLVYAREQGAGHRELSSFVVESNVPGFSVGKKEEKLGMKQSPTCQLIFDESPVPKENLIGQEKSKALLYMMRNLEIERITLAAMSLGIARRCLDEMIPYATNMRKAFGRPLSDFGQIQQLIAESYSRYTASRCHVYEAAGRINPRERASLSAASAKLSATQMAEYVSRVAIQVFGGMGYTRDVPVERLHRDAILLSIGGGTNEAMQKNMLKDLEQFYAE